MVTLDGTGVTLTDRDACHVDFLADLKQVHANFAAETQAGKLFWRGCEFFQNATGFNTGFAALRASPDEVSAIQACLQRREAGLNFVPAEEAIDLDLQFHTAVMAASHNTLFQQLSAVIRQPFRTALAYTVRLPASVKLETEEYRALFEAIRDRNPLAARSASDKIVGLAMIAVEQIIRSMEKTS